MANWQYIINFKDLWEEFDKEKSAADIGKQVAIRLEAMLPKFQKNKLIDDDDIYELEEIIIDFKFIENTDNFDSVLDRLYNWADMPLPTPRGEMQRKILWIKTF